ncbi:flippase-like domain-containing protein [Halomicroarcula limicola]|uniref:Flippase-like domain-containing protein n=1 Tax=Haloarcula limicola TaxID=1429915 RepID=A0A8J7YBI4_9EURY|nr:lysylphosphatidylglycerol synthase transmembrane domain-containing protein [Halomicroarcula limicola]MBV0924216.1 flippase-like domain-containing protein [Halomicroarcula limicola]
MATSRRDLLVSVLQYGVGIVALGVLLTQVDFGVVVDRLSNTSPAVVAALGVVTVAGLVARFYTWSAIISPFTSIALGTAGRIDLTVNFINQLLPSRLSGRVAAPFVLRAETGMEYADATAATGAHTGIYAVLYGVASLLGLAAAYDRLSTGVLLLLGLSTGLYFVAGAVVLLAGVNLTLFDRVVEAMADLAASVPRVGAAVAEKIRGITEITSSSTDSFRAIVGDATVWFRYAVGWTGALVVAPGVRVWLLFASFGASVEPAVLLPLYLVAAYSVTLLPLTPGGIGVTEATATAVFVGLGVPSDVVIPVIFVDRFLGVYLPALAGWYPSLSMDLSVL